MKTLYIPVYASTMSCADWVLQPITRQQRLHWCLLPILCQCHIGTQNALQSAPSLSASSLDLYVTHCWPVLTCLSQLRITEYASSHCCNAQLLHCLADPPICEVAPQDHAWCHRCDTSLPVTTLCPMASVCWSCCSRLCSGSLWALKELPGSIR